MLGDIERENYEYARETGQKKRFFHARLPNFKKRETLAPPSPLTLHATYTSIPMQYGTYSFYVL